MRYTARSRDFTEVELTAFSIIVTGCRQKALRAYAPRPTPAQPVVWYCPALRSTSTIQVATSSTAHAGLTEGYGLAVCTNLLHSQGPEMPSGSTQATHQHTPEVTQHSNKAWQRALVLFVFLTHI
eukprot:GHRR01026747.1.p1 GENE.GHRR01026747.1~~GHRR01026747.1.p1  ORF type:complete len:125 (+),score=22.56 GHRR01026747.1:203-577(+)